MSWLTAADIAARVQASLLLVLADDDGDEAADAAVLLAVCSDAEGEVESRLAGRYAVPFLTSEPVLVEIASALAIDRLYLRKNVESPPHVKEALATALESLERIARGEAHLTCVAPRGEMARSTASAEERVFTREGLEKY